MITQPVNDLSTIATLTELRKGWYSAIELAWLMTAPDDDWQARGAAKAALSELYHLGVIEKIVCRHNKADLSVYLIEPDKIRQALEAWAS